MLSELHRQQYTCKVVCENPQTLLWLFNHSTYLAWLGNNDPCTLYIYGQCGVGKTILSSFLWKNLQRMGQAEEDDAVTAVYFSFHHEDERRNSIKSLLSSIIYQLLVYQPQIFISIQVHFDWIRRSWPLTMEELWIVFRSLISHPIQGKIVCIIDAIDRCNVPFDATLRSLLAFTKSREARFKVVATSRRSPESLHHPPLFSINLDSQKEIRSDIQVCIKMHVHELLQDNRALLEFETQIVEDFQNRTTHLEIVLGFQSLKGPRLRSIPRYIRKTLQSLHYSPSEVCDQILNDFTKLEPWARIALSWITLAFRPLTFGELSIAVAIRETTISYSEVENDVSRDIARDLKQVFDAIICTKHDEIRFIHKSIKDCLLASLRSSNQQHPSLDLTHTDLARRCLTYLSFPDLEEYLASRPVKASSQAYSSPARFDMLGYALEYWPEHYQRAESKESLNGLALEFLKNDRNFERWNEHPTFEHFRQKRRSCSASPLQVATRLGLTEIVIMLLSEDGGGSITLNDKQAALDMSVEKGDKKITTELLNDGVTTPRVLSLAARHGNSELVKQLLNEGGTKGLENDESHDTDGAPDSQGNSDTDSVNATDGHSPLQIAALRGHTAVIHTLLEAGDSPELINTSGDTSFSLAVKGGQLAALKELLRGRSAIEIDFSLLHLAASQGHLEIVRELIRNGVDPNAIGKDGSTPLLLAAEGGRAELVKELINISRAVLEATNDAGSRAVHVAATNGHIQAFEHLCRAGADINAQDDDGSGPIHLAAKMGHLRVTKSLLESGVNSNIPDRSGFTPLHLATRGGYLRIVQELINHARSHPEAHPDPKLKSRVATGGLEETARDETKDFESSRDEGDAETDKFLDDHDNGHQHLDGSSDESLVSSDMLDYSDDESSSDFDDSHNLLKFQDSDEATPLHSAAARGYMEILRELLKNDAQYNKHGKHHRTPLHLAAREGYVSVVKELLQRSADPNTADLKQSSPLHAASTSGNLLMVKTLLEFGAAANKTDNNKISPLYQAARHGHVDVVKQLLEAGAELEATSALGQTSLQIAVSQRHSDVVAALLTKGANPNTTSRLGWTALHFAVSGKDIGTDLISKLIQFGVDVHASNDSGSTALFLAAERGSEAAVRLLLGAGARVDAKNTANSTPMHRAAQEGHLKVVKMLMEAGANPLAKKRRDITPLHLALENEHLDVAAQLLEPTNADIPSINDYEEILHLLAMVGFAEGITKALNYPLCNLERADSEYQQSPLSHAAERGHESVVQVLLNRGADPNSLDNTGKSPLSWAAWGGYEVVARQLLRNGADIQSKDHQQWTALHFAVVIGNVPTVDFLLGMGADLSATFDEGFTALHLAVGNDYLEVIQLLLEKGASIFSESLIHFTPLAFAVRWAGASTVKLLLDYGADCSSSSPETNFELKIAINRGDKDILDLLVHGCGDNIANQQGWTRLHLASFCGDKTSVREQLEQKVDRNVKDRDGLTALHLAAVQSHEDVVCLMLEMNTEVQSRDNEGMTTLHHAASTGTARMVTALLEKGAENNVIDLHGWNPLQIAQMYANNEICAILSADSETGMVPGTGSCLAPSHLVKAIESSQTTLSGHGLTVTTGKTGLYYLDPSLRALNVAQIQSEIRNC